MMGEHQVRRRRSAAVLVLVLGRHPPGGACTGAMHAAFALAAAELLDHIKCGIAKKILGGGGGRAVFPRKA